MYKKYKVNPSHPKPAPAVPVSGLQVKKTSSHSDGRRVKRDKESDRDGMPKLHQAVLHGADHDCLIGHMIQEGSDVNEKDCVGQQPLHLAAKSGYLGCTKRLIKHGAELETLDQAGRTPLMEAAYADHIDVVECLVQCGASVNKQNDQKETALHFAALNPGGQSLKFLIQSRASLNSEDINGVTPLFMACKVQGLDAVEALLKGGANPNRVDIFGFTPLQYVSGGSDRNLGIAKALISAGASVDACKRDGEAAFVLAIRNNNHKILKCLIKSGCDITNVDGLNGTALALATLCGNTECVKILLDNGEDPDEVAYYGMTALMCASYQSNVRMVNLLLKAGADPNVVSRVGRTALFTAIIKVLSENEIPRHEVTKLLLRAGADVNHRIRGAMVYTSCTQGRNCILSFAITSGYVSLVLMVLLAGYSYLTPCMVKQWKEATKRIYEGNVSGLYMYFNACPIFCAIEKFASNPRSLKHLCRAQIRASLGTVHIQDTIQELPVANLMKSYLNFSEFDTMPPSKSQNYEVYRKNGVVFNESEVVTACGLNAIEKEYGFIKT